MQHLPPLTRSTISGMYAKYYPSVAFLPSVALGTLLTTNCGNEKAASAAANMKYYQWNVRYVLSIDDFFMSAPLLHHSDKKLGLVTL